MREFSFTLNEYDPARPWIVVATEHQTVELPEGVGFLEWSRKQWPPPRWRVELDPGRWGR